MRWVLSLVTLAAFAAGPPEKLWRNPKDGMQFVWIPGAGNGSPGFWMGRTEVTVRQFRRFVRETGHCTSVETAGNKANWKSPGFKQADNHPVIYMSRQDAISYTAWAGVELPTEPDWLYACRAGANTRFYWGDEVDDRYVWHRENSPEGTHPVARKLPNAWGLYDMVGNAWEWCKPLKEDGTPCEVMAVIRGASFTRCPRYLTRQGYIFNTGLSEAVEPPLSKCDPNALMYPWDDDRGFRCAYRAPAPSAGR